MTKIDIFSGFLGAGKTTLIKKLIAEAYTGEKIVLIENEFGEIAIDGGFLKDSGVQINEMNSGCICCSLVGDFADALQKVLAQFHPDRILIEPSGVGKLSDVIRAVQGVQSDELVLNGFTTVVDANKCRMYMKNFGEFFNNQVENASAIILSRTEGIRPEKLDAAVALLREKNPTATIVTTPWTELDGKQIDYFPTTTELKRCKPIFEKLPGWKCDIRGIKKFEDLPENARHYVEFAEKHLGVPVCMVSNGPAREDIMYR